MGDFTKLNGYDVKDSEARTNIGTLTSLNTNEKSNLVGSINEVNTLVNKFNLSNVESITFTESGGLMLGQSVKLAYDDSGSIGKIYGRIVLNTSGYNLSSVTLTATLPFNVGTGFIIDNIGLRFIYNLAINNLIDVKGFNMSLSGTTATITFNNNSSEDGRHSLEFYASIIFFKDFGDTGED